MIGGIVTFQMMIGFVRMVNQMIKKNLNVSYTDGLIHKAHIMEILEEYYGAVRGAAILKAKLFNNEISTYDMMKLGFIEEMAKEIAQLPSIGTW